MSDAFSLGHVPGMVENLNLFKSGLMARHGRPNSHIQTGFGPWWLGVIATGAILTNSGVAAQTPEQIELGRQLFMEETFDGNGRTCATCHPQATISRSTLLTSGR